VTIFIYQRIFGRKENTQSCQFRNKIIHILKTTSGKSVSKFILLFKLFNIKRILLEVCTTLEQHPSYKDYFFFSSSEIDGVINPVYGWILHTFLIMNFC